MKYTIAICDDEIIFSSQFENLLTDTLKAMSLSFDIDVYNDSNALCSYIGNPENSPYDLIFLDIEMPDKDGLSIGNYIRNILKDEITQIAYISSKESYAMELFDFRPLHFLIKPINQDKLKNVITTYINISEHNTQKFTYKKGHEQFSIPLKDIIYFENKIRKIVIHCQTRTDEFYGSLKEINEQLQNYKFLYIHNSYIVNYTQICNLAYEYVIMTDGTQIPISQNRRPEIRNKCIQLYKELHQ